MSALSSERVQAIFKACESSDDAPNGVVVQGVVHKTCLNKEELEKHRQEITEMLSDLPEQFQENSGGGWSFLNACQDKHGNQWTDYHLVMEMLFMLGEAIGKVKPVMPREMWSVLPGGVPYYVVAA